ncbi:hypothetical protein ACEPAG_5386 [Sanghuangporus baumii]
MAEYLDREEKIATSIPGLPKPNSSGYLDREADLTKDSKSTPYSEALSTNFILLSLSRLYRRTYASPSFRKIYEILPIPNIYDDHEVINNFVGKDDDSTRPYPNASSAFYLYNGQANYCSRYEGHYYYDFRYGDAVFFVLDTRRYRSDASDEGYPTILGNQQLRDLMDWLGEVNQTSTFKFIVSSAPFTTLWQHDAQTDSWAAFRHERSIILDLLHTVPNVFILTGDRHEFAAIEFNGPFDWSNTIYEFSTSSLNMFYVPFFRTLDMESSEHVERSRLKSRFSHEGMTSEIREKYSIPGERVLKYLPSGNHKWISFEIDSRDPLKPTIFIEVIIEGQVAYKWSKIGSSAPTKRTTSLSPNANFAEKLGLGRS